MQFKSWFFIAKYFYEMFFNTYFLQFYVFEHKIEVKMLCIFSANLAKMSELYNQRNKANDFILIMSVICTFVWICNYCLK